MESDLPQDEVFSIPEIKDDDVDGHDRKRARLLDDEDDIQLEEQFEPLPMAVPNINIVATGVSRRPFTPAEDDLLREGVYKYSSDGAGTNPDWSKVSENVGSERDRQQCLLRWSLFLQPFLLGLVKNPWSPQEVAVLMDQINKQRESGTSVNKLDWDKIRRVVGRTESECMNQYRCLINAALRKGPFTRIEDETILKMKSENATFESIGRQLGRPGKRCSERYAKLIMKPKVPNEIRGGRPLIGTEEDDRLLREGFELYGRKGVGGRPDWNAITNHINNALSNQNSNGFSRQQVSRRWQAFLDPTLEGLKGMRDPWLPDEDTRLLESVSRRRKDEDKGGKIIWTAVRQDMCRSEQDCRNRWKELIDAAKKKGHFTPEEDEIVLKLRTEGVSWTGIGEAIGRSGKRCSERYKKISVRKSDSPYISPGLGLGHMGMSMNTSNMTASHDMNHHILAMQLASNAPVDMITEDSLGLRMMDNEQHQVIAAVEDYVSIALSGETSII